MFDWLRRPAPPTAPGPDLARDLAALERRTRKIESDETQRSLEWLEYVTKLERMVRRMARVEERNQGPSARGGRSDTPGPELVPPRGLRGARLRIWYREHGAVAPGPNEHLNGDPEALAEAETGTEG